MLHINAHSLVPFRTPAVKKLASGMPVGPADIDWRTWCPTCADGFLAFTKLVKYHVDPHLSLSSTAPKPHALDIFDLPPSCPPSTLNVILKLPLTFTLLAYHMVKYLLKCAAARYKLQWISQQPIMTEPCFNFLIILPVSIEFLRYQTILTLKKVVL